MFDLLAGPLRRATCSLTDLFLLGGSGHYSATAEGAWIETALESLRLVHDLRRPTFASCWGFQAMARAMGGRVVHDLSRAELGTHRLYLTDAGRDDPVFGPLGDEFDGQMGHEDCVDRLPPGATLLASSGRLANQAYRFDGMPIYCTQFHPELTRDDMLRRVAAYPRYVETIAGVPLERFREQVTETPAARALLPRFIDHVFG